MRLYFHREKTFTADQVVIAVLHKSYEFTLSSDIVWAAFNLLMQSMSAKMIIPLNYTRQPTIRNSNSNSVGCSFPWNFRWRCAVLRIKIAKDFIYMTVIVYWVIQWGTKKTHNKLYLWYIFTPNFLTTYSLPLYFTQWHQLEKKDNHLHSRLWWIQFLVQLFCNLHTSAFCPCVPLLGMVSWQPPFHKLKSRKQLCFLQLLFGGFNVTKCCFMVKIN